MPGRWALDTDRGWPAQAPGRPLGESDRVPDNVRPFILRGFAWQCLGGTPDDGLYRFDAQGGIHRYKFTLT